MKSRDFPLKTKSFFLPNHSLSDRSAHRDDEMLRSNGLETVPFGEGRRFEKVWETGRGKPDCIIRRDGREIALLDWKGKRRTIGQHEGA
jgi:hypothetical protein